MIIPITLIFLRRDLEGMMTIKLGTQNHACHESVRGTRSQASWSANCRAASVQQHNPGREISPRLQNGNNHLSNNEMSQYMDHN